MLSERPETDSFESSDVFDSSIRSSKKKKSSPKENSKFKLKAKNKTKTKESDFSAMAQTMIMKSNIPDVKRHKTDNSKFDQIK